MHSLQCLMLKDLPTINDIVAIEQPGDLAGWTKRSTETCLKPTAQRLAKRQPVDSAAEAPREADRSYDTTKPIPSRRPMADHGRCNQPTADHIVDQRKLASFKVEPTQYSN
jgi:hypothetical protein